MAVISPSVCRMSIVVGIIELVVASICVIMGIIQMLNYSGHISSSSGLWMLLYGVPGVLSIVAGRTGSIGVMAAALFFNIIVTILSALATLFCALFWMMIASDGCTNVDYNIECSEVHKVTAIIAVITIIMFILVATSFTGCVLGCMGTCCANPDPVFVATVPAQQSTVVVANQHTTQYPQPSFHPMIPQHTAGVTVQNYTGPPAPAYGVQNFAGPPTADDKSLVENIVI